MIKNCLFCEKEFKCKSDLNMYCSNKCQIRYQRKLLIDSEKTSSRILKSYLVDNKNECNICKISSWNSKPLILELDHIDGNHMNNTLNNVRLLCPNCHSQTDTFKNRNKGKGRKYRRKLGP